MLSSKYFAYLEESLFKKIKQEKIEIIKRGFIYLSDSIFAVPVSKVIKLYKLEEECFLITELINNQLLPHEVEVTVLISPTRFMYVTHFFNKNYIHKLDKQITKGIYAGLNGKELFIMLGGEYMVNRIEKAAEDLIKELIDDSFEEIFKQNAYL